MICKTITTILLFTASLALIACSTAPKQIHLDKRLEATMAEIGAVGAILFTPKGKVVLTDPKGKVAPKCSIRPSEKQPRCEGVAKDKEILDVKSIIMLKGTGSPDCWTTYDMHGEPQQLCW